MYFNILTLAFPLKVLIFDPIDPHIEDGALGRQPFQLEELPARQQNLELALLVLVEAGGLAVLLIDAREDGFAVESAVQVAGQFVVLW